MEVLANGYHEKWQWLQHLCQYFLYLILINSKSDAFLNFLETLNNKVYYRTLISALLSTFCSWRYFIMEIHYNFMIILEIHYNFIIIPSPNTNETQLYHILQTALPLTLASITHQVETLNHHLNEMLSSIMQVESVN